MNTSDKLLTVIVPSYNMEEYLPKCLGSLIVPDRDMLQRLDVIVVNDGSTDRTSEIAHQFERDYPGVFRIIDKDNGNYGSCINAAIPESQGRYVKILDADDTFDTAAFALFFLFISRETSADGPDVIVSDFVVVDRLGNEIKRNTFGKEGDTSFSLSTLDYRNGRYMWRHALAYRTTLVQSIGYRQTEGIFYTDQEWVAIPMMSAKTFRRFPRPLYRYLVGREGQSVDLPVKCRNFSMHFVVQKAIVSAWLSACNSTPIANHCFVRELIEGHLRAFYYEFLVHSPNALNQADLAEYDSFIAKHVPDIHENTRHLSTKICRFLPPFQYVEVWRRTYSRKSGMFKLLDMATTLREKKKMLRRSSLCQFKHKSGQTMPEPHAYAHREHMTPTALIQLKEEQPWKVEYNAGLKAPSDIDEILQKSGFLTFRVPAVRPRSFIYRQITNAYRFAKSLFIALSVPQRSLVISQYPSKFAGRKPGLFCLDVLRFVKHAKCVILVHDIESARGRGDIAKSGIDKNLHALIHRTDVIIVHNQRMLSWLASRGVHPSRMVSLEVFDYLAQPTKPSPTPTFNRSVSIAGNMSPIKSPFISLLREIEDITWNLYGPGFDSDNSLATNVHYHGAFPPEQILEKLNSGFGLVWDGDSIETCHGDSGEYMKINNPHKLSLYLAAGIPVIVWEESAASLFVRKYDIGISITSLRAIGSIFENMSATRYQTLCRNVANLSDKIRTGYFTKQAIAQSIGIAMDTQNTYSHCLSK